MPNIWGDYIQKKNILQPMNPIIYININYNVNISQYQWKTRTFLRDSDSN